MSFLSKIFAAGAGTLVKSVGSVIDDLHTSGEEKLKLKAKIDGQLQAFELSMETAAMQFEKEVSKRHQADMTSDSWLSKNIRPLLVGFLIMSTIILAYSTIFTLPEEKITLIEPWIGLLTTLDVAAITFYFGSRGVEKFKKISLK